ncbi:MAG: glycoside hydrolase family 2 TIM barrel-domain containing protein [Deinococcales bacterium]
MFAKPAKPQKLGVTLLTVILAGLWFLPMLWLLNPLDLVRSVLSFIASLGNLAETWQDLRDYLASGSFFKSLEWRWYLNSMGLSLSITLLTLLVCAPCAYAMSTLDFPGKNWLFWLLIVGIILPKETLMAPLFIDLARVGLANHYIGIGLPQVVAPLIILVFKYYFDQVPKEIAEAAVIDGSSPLHTLLHIYLPLNRTLIIILAIYTFITAWNNFFWPFIITYSEELMTLPVALGTQGFGPFGFNALIVTIVLLFLLGFTLQQLFIRTGIIRLANAYQPIQFRIKPLLYVLGSFTAIIGILWAIISIQTDIKLRTQLSTPLMTRWGEELQEQLNVDSIPLPEYPRPQFERSNWLNLNGFWDYALNKKAQPPQDYQGQILVPFPVESALSRVSLRADGRYLWYRRSFQIPEAWQGQRIILHFGAVDWHSKLWVNQQEVGEHRGGYDAFSFDITDHLSQGVQEIALRVEDPSDKGVQPRGKQVREPEGIWYRSTTGVWQTVWLEPLPPHHLNTLTLTPHPKTRQLNLNLTHNIPETVKANYQLHITANEADQVVAEFKGPLQESIKLNFSQAHKLKLWSPQDPFLYDLKISLWQGEDLIDEVKSYAGMRSIEIAPDENGVMRLFLNDEVLFHYGLLDQGFWPDGLYTAPSDEALRYDIEVSKSLGFNMIRKHVKVESERWYYWADKLGVLVWQDMPSGDESVADGAGELERSAASAKQFEQELKAMIDGRYNHPSIVMWILFNEGWGQYDTARLTTWLKSYDPSRLINSASGWNDMQVGDLRDIHSYPGPNAPQNYPDRASALGEFGGLGLAIKGLTWQDTANWGYQHYNDREQLMEAYAKLVSRLRYLNVEEGLAAAVYTQTTDVEIEVNGVMTYDRKLIKLEPVRTKWVNRILYRDPPIISSFVPTAPKGSVLWRYSFEEPPEGWTLPAFDDSAWAEGLGGFGDAQVRGASSQSEWKTSDIWLRHSFNLSSRYALYPYLEAHHNDAMEIYLNGQLIKKLPNYTFEYVRIPLDDGVKGSLKEGKNTLSIHCQRITSGQYCDAGLFDSNEKLDRSR